MRGAKAVMILAAAGLLSGGSGALAQTVPGTSNSWHRVCETDSASQVQVCHVGSDLWNARGDIVATVAVRSQSQPGQPTRRIFVAVVPIGVLVQPRLRLEIDGRNTREIPFDYCDQTGCYATISENPADPASVTAMNALEADIRARNNLTLVVSTPSSTNPTVRYAFSLAGTAATFSGPAMTPQQLIQQTNERRAALQAQSAAGATP